MARKIDLTRALRAPATAKTPAPTTSWSTRPDPTDRAKQRRRREAEASRAEAAHARWAQRHPEAAAAERRLRKRRAATLDRWRHKNDGTPETHEHAARTRQGALARLYLAGGIDAEQLAAAVEIQTVAERIAGDVDVRTASLETRVDRTRLGDGTFYERLSHVRHEIAYSRWRGQVRGPIAAVLAMVVGEPIGEPVAFTHAARRWRMHNRRAKQLLKDALDLWPRILRDVVREVDDAAMAAAHAGL